MISNETKEKKTKPCIKCQEDNNDVDDDAHRINIYIYTHLSRKLISVQQILMKRQ